MKILKRVIKILTLVVDILTLGKLVKKGVKDLKGGDN